MDDDDDDYNDEIDAMEDSLSVPSGDTDIYRLMEVETMMMKEGENEGPGKQEEVNEVKSTDESSNTSSTNNRFIASAWTSNGDYQTRGTLAGTSQADVDDWFLLPNH